MFGQSRAICDPSQGLQLFLVTPPDSYSVDPRTVVITISSEPDSRKWGESAVLPAPSSSIRQVAKIEEHWLTFEEIGRTRCLLQVVGLQEQNSNSRTMFSDAGN